MSFWVPKCVIWGALGPHLGTLGAYLRVAGHPIGHTGVHIEIFTDLGWILGGFWDPIWCHLGDILMIWDTKLTVQVTGWSFWWFWSHLGVAEVKKSMVFTVRDTLCLLWSKVMFCIHCALILELIWEPWGTFWSFREVLETGWNFDGFGDLPRGWPKRVHRVKGG